MCFFPKILEYSGLWSFSVFPCCQCVYTHQAGRTPALQQNWKSSEKSQNFKEKTQYLMNTLCRLYRMLPLPFSVPLLIQNKHGNFPLSLFSSVPSFFSQSMLLFSPLYIVLIKYFMCSNLSDDISPMMILGKQSRKAGEVKTKSNKSWGCF